MRRTALKNESRRFNRQREVMRSATAKGQNFTPAAVLEVKKAIKKLLADKRWKTLRVDPNIQEVEDSVAFKATVIGTSGTPSC